MKEPLCKKETATIRINSEPPKPTTFEDLGYVQVVRCEDCKKRYTVLCIQEEVGNINNQDGWFCADGVAKDINVPNKEGR